MTPAPRATASTGPSRPPAPTSPAASPPEADRRVHLRAFAKVGAQSSDLAGQIDRALADDPDLAVILVGANDVTHQVRPSQSVRHLADGVRRLREAGAKVLVGTCPDLGTVKPIPPPLKQVARSWSRRLAAAQAIAIVEEEGVAVSLGSILGPDFEAAPALLFGPDRFHPSAEGYRALAEVLVPERAQRAGLRRGRAAGVPAARAPCPSPPRPSARPRRPAPSSETRRASGWSCAGVPGSAPSQRPPQDDEVVSDA